MADRKKDSLYKSFGYAFEGIFTCIRKERNMKIHCTVAALVVIAGVILGLSVTEWCICLGLFGMVMSLELVNTAVEAVVDLVTSERHPLAKIAKDTAAGAVLIAAIMAAIHAMGNGKYTLKAVRRSKNGWGKAGVNDTTAPF